MNLGETIDLDDNQDKTSAKGNDNSLKNKNSLQQITKKKMLDGSLQDDRSVSFKGLNRSFSDISYD